ncbi:histidine kinase [Oceanicola sp. 22II-s10i]|uniref:GAF domain-containing protein n=1 Tax=Oceanicola sp. 22II-s10i TaxID=1317116 RepID=UPI000B707DD4|nr:GAF domain-containing protein [Oceanicola sp. 22II-s10i]OWU83906.1 histidine kinase [Oceanicola sp. 22II-s10i]
MTPTLDMLRRSLEGVYASVLATCDEDGLPNVSMISQVHYLDPDHVALSYQFFNKTRENLLRTRMATVQVADPANFAQHRIELDYLETRTGGPVFETMKAKLAGIASHHGMESVFRLLGADIFRVRSIEPVPGPAMEPCAAANGLLAAVRLACTALEAAADLDDLLETGTACLETQFGIAHSMILMTEDDEDRLFTVASRGYRRSGIGSEVAFGEGVIGVAASEGVPIRICHMTSDYRYGATISETARQAGLIGRSIQVIPFPGLPNPGSQIALPLRSGSRLLGVLFAETEQVMRFDHEVEDALAVIAMHLGARIAQFLRDDADDEEPVEPEARPAEGSVALRFHPHDQSVFLDNDYLIKGVAGAILWRLVREHADTGRTEFTTRELRLDASLRLPAHAENLDARLILLRKRLEERGACLRIEKSGRGRFRLNILCGLSLMEMAD